MASSNVVSVRSYLIQKAGMAEAPRAVKEECWRTRDQDHLRLVGDIAAKHNLQVEWLVDNDSNLLGFDGIGVIDMFLSAFTGDKNELVAKNSAVAIIAGEYKAPVVETTPVVETKAETVVEPIAAPVEQKQVLTCNCNDCGTSPKKALRGPTRDFVVPKVGVAKDVLRRRVKAEDLTSLCLHKTHAWKGLPGFKLTQDQVIWYQLGERFLVEAEERKAEVEAERAELLSSSKVRPGLLHRGKCGYWCQVVKQTKKGKVIELFLVEQLYVPELKFVRFNNRGELTPAAVMRFAVPFFAKGAYGNVEMTRLDVALAAQWPSTFPYLAPIDPKKAADEAAKARAEMENEMAG